MSMNVLVAEIDVGKYHVGVCRALKSLSLSLRFACSATMCVGGRKIK